MKFLKGLFLQDRQLLVIIGYDKAFFTIPRKVHYALACCVARTKTTTQFEKCIIDVCRHLTWEAEYYNDYAKIIIKQGHIIFYSFHNILQLLRNGVFSH